MTLSGCTRGEAERHRRVRQESFGDARLAALLNAIAAVVAETDTGTLLRMVVTAGATLVDADYGAFAILGAQGDVVDLVAHGVGSDDAQRLGLLPERSGLLAKLISTNGVTRLDDVRCMQATRTSLHDTRAWGRCSACRSPPAER